MCEIILPGELFSCAGQGDYCFLVPDRVLSFAERVWVVGLRVVGSWPIRQFMGSFDV